MNDSDDRYIDEDYEEAFDYGDFDVERDSFNDEDYDYREHY